MRNNPRLLILSPLLALTLIATACSSDDGDSGTASAPTTAPAVTSTAAVQPTRPPAAANTPAPVTSEVFDKTKATTTPSGLLYIDAVVGTGASPQPTQTVLVNYTGKLASNGRVFDSTAGKAPISFALNRVIRGFSEGIQTMQAGGKRTIYIPAALGYAAAPPAGSGIPANADLVFEIELISFQ